MEEEKEEEKGVARRRRVCLTKTKWKARSPNSGGTSALDVIGKRSWIVLERKRESGSHSALPGDQRDLAGLAGRLGRQAERAGKGRGWLGLRSGWRVLIPRT